MQFKLGTFSTAGCEPFPGLVIEERVIAMSFIARLCREAGLPLSGHHSVLALLEDWETNLQSLKRAVEIVGKNDHDEAVSIDALRIHPPVNLPRQVFCSGANYRQHVIDYIMDTGGGPDTEDLSPEERRAEAEKIMDERAATGSPYMFVKVVSAITGARDPILLPPNTNEADWELELAVVIGKLARHVSRDKAMDYIAGYTIANDISSRDLIFRRDIKAMGTDWTAGKNSPTFMPLGPYLVPKKFVDNPQDLQITLKLNGDVMQDESTADMIFDIPRQIEYLSGLVQLWPGDVIATGSPAGNAMHYDNRFLRPGDVMEGTITGLGMQRNECRKEDS